MMTNNDKNFSQLVKEKFDFAKNKIKTSFKNRKQYQIFQSKQFLGIILVAITVFLIIFSIVPIPGFATINSYTLGMLFGYYSYFIYAGMLLYGLSQIFQINIWFEKFIAVKFSKKLHFSWLSYLILAIGIALVAESIRQWVIDGLVFPADRAFGNFFGSWWNNFSNNDGASGNPALPGIFNQGIIVSLFMSLITIWSGYIVSIILGLLLIAYFIIYMLYGPIIKKIRYQVLGKANKREIVTKEEFEDYKTKVMDLSFEDHSAIVNKPENEITTNVDAKTSTITITNSDLMFPIDNPFTEDTENNKQDFIESKTLQLNLEKNNTKEFKLDVVDNQIQSNPEDDNKTFDFELDIFKTSTDFMNFDDNGISMNTKNVDLSNTSSNDIDFNINNVKNINNIDNNINDDEQYDSKTIVFQNDPTVEKTIQFASDLTTEVNTSNDDVLFSTKPLDLNNTNEIINEDTQKITNEITNDVTDEITNEIETESTSKINESLYEDITTNETDLEEDVLFKNDEDE